MGALMDIILRFNLVNALLVTQTVLVAMGLTTIIVKFVQMLQNI